MPIITPPLKTCTQKAKLLSFFETSQWTDCTFIVGNEKIGCHKIILAASSPVFEAMLFGPMASSEILISDISAEDFKQTLKYIYSSKIDFASVTNAWAIVYIVKKYLLDELLELCREYIQYHIDSNNVLLSLEYAELYSEFELQDKCLCAISQYPQAVFSCCMDDHIAPAMFRRLLEIDDLNITEKDVMEYTVKWAKDECIHREIESTKANVREMLVKSGIFRKLRFTSIPVSEYGDAVRALLTDEEIALIAVWQESLRKEDSLSLEQCDISCEWKPRSFALNQPPAKFRQIYKAANSLMLTEPTSVRTGIISNKRAILMGLVLGIERFRYNDANNDFYTENCNVEIFDEENRSVLKKHINNEVNYHSFNVVDFQGSVILEENRSYDIVISWSTVPQPFMIYSTYILEPTLKTKSVEVRFAESGYSIIQGLCIF